MNHCKRCGTDMRGVVTRHHCPRCLGPRARRRFKMNGSIAPKPPEGFKVENFKDELGPMPKCKHGMIAAICSACTMEHKHELGQPYQDRQGYTFRACECGYTERLVQVGDAGYDWEAES